jgi:5-methyltetrahydrofolate--homocysteine methyltransferase
MINLFRHRVQNEILVMSGAMGTMLHKSGSNLSGCLSKWIIEHPEVYRNLVSEYFQVGCDIVAAATSTAHRLFLTKFGLQEKVNELNRGVIQIIKEIKPNYAFIAGNIGPSGKILKPLGDLSPSTLFEAYAEQCLALAESGAEIINILTMYDLEETLLALRAAQKYTSLPIIVSLAFNPAPQGFRTMMGVSPEIAAKRLAAEGADVIGANCGQVNLAQMTQIIKLMKDSCEKPLIAKPNAGIPQLAAGEEKYAATPEHFAEHVAEWVLAGARIVSACCGSGPPHIQKMVEKLKEQGLLKIKK